MFSDSDWNKFDAGFSVAASSDNASVKGGLATSSVGRGTFSKGAVFGDFSVIWEFGFMPSSFEPGVSLAGDLGGTTLLPISVVVLVVDSSVFSAAGTAGRNLE